jgi:HEAT repeat protein
VNKPFRIRNILIVLIVCVLGAITLRAFVDREPTFEGRRLSYWVWIMKFKQAGPEKEKARSVVCMLGTNSIPLLLDWLRQEDRPSMTARFDKVRHSVFFWLVGHGIIANRPITSLRHFNPSHRGMATYALPELGPAGKQTSIPTLIQMLGDKKRNPDEMSHTAGAAFLVLSRMAPESIDPLIVALSSQDIQVRMLAAAALARIGPAAKSAIPVLEKTLGDKDPNIRVSAAEVIGKLGGDPGSFIPVVVQTLPEINRENLDYVLTVLLRYKDHAKTAVPVLIEILNKTAHSTNEIDSLVRGQIINVLREIDTSALRPAP